MTFNIFINTNTFPIILNAKFKTYICQWSHYNPYGAFRRILGCTKLTYGPEKCISA